MAAAYRGTDNGGIEGLENIKATQSSFPFARRARPPPVQIFARREDRREPVKPEPIQRRESKGGLRGIFTRNRGEKTPFSPTAEEEPPWSAFSERSMKTIGEATFDRHVSSKTATLAVDVPVTPAKIPSTPSRLNLRSKSVKHNKTPSKPSPKASTKSSPNRPTRTSAAWDPPPLFQAYPQAIKHAQLTASTLSADSIIRLSSQRKDNSVNGYTSNQSAGDRQDQATAAKKTEKARNKHRRQISGSISKADWTQKIFVLVTSGYLLQYSADGSFDRLPEKMMQLGKDSVAFASDVIPGKHWVLQISQSMDADGTPMADSRSLLSRLTFRGADYRRSATSQLLILNSAEEMDSWIAVVRREIEGLGGKQLTSETGNPKSDGKIIQLKAQPSHRYLVRKDVDQASIPTSAISSSFDPLPWTRNNSLRSNVEETGSVAWSQPVPRPSTGHRSTTNSAAFHNDHQSEEVKDFDRRSSFISSGEDTFVASQCSSPETAATRDSGSITCDDDTPKPFLEDSRSKPNATAISERRRSMQIVPIPFLESQQVPNVHRHSTYGPTVTTPNFSVPNSSSRRFSSIKTNNVPSIQRSQSTQSIRINETTKNGSRRAPPPALSIARPLSPVKDSPSPKRTVPIVTPTESSFKTVQQIRASVVDIPPRLSVVPPANEPKRLRRVSSLLPLNPPITSHPDFQFPRRHSSLLTLRDTSVQSEDETAPLSSEAFKIALPNPQNQRTSTEILPTEHEKEADPVLPNIANVGTKLRRPISMQIQSSTPNSKTNTAIHSKPGKSAPPVSSVTQITQANVAQSNMKGKPTALTPLSPSLQRLRLESNAKALANRKSMPILMGGPPPAPPPNCALPPLPPPSRSGSRSKRPVGVRTTVMA